MEDNNTNLWEEKNSTEQSKNYESNQTNVPNDTINEINNRLTKNQWNGIGKISGIYKIINKVNGKYYVGMSSNIVKSRWKKHKRFLKDNIHWNKKLQNAWNKYGEENFEWKIIEIIEKEKLNVIEQKYLDVAKNEQHTCYNLSFHSKEVFLDKNARAKISEYNKKHRVYSSEFKNNISSAAKERLSDPKNNPMYGKTHLDKAKSQISIKNTDHTKHRWYNKFTKIFKYCSCRDLYIEFNLDRSNINSVLHGKAKSSHGWILIKEKND